MEDGGGGESRSLEFTPTWVVATVCFVIVLISFLVERSLHKLGKWFRRKNQDALYDALEKLKEELMLLGFISLLLTVSQNVVSRICIPANAAAFMLPCKMKSVSHESSHFNGRNGRWLLHADAEPKHCTGEGQGSFLSLEALHHLHIFIFVLAVVHVVFCVSTMLLGGARIKQWKHWESSIVEVGQKSRDGHNNNHHHHHLHYHNPFIDRAGNYWRKFTVVSVIFAFFKQFYGSITQSDYTALRSGFMLAHCPNTPEFDFHKYMLRTLEHDFKKLVAVNWYLWLFAILFLLMNIAGWHTYFWLSFLPLVLLLLVGTKLEYIITKLAKEVAETRTSKECDPRPVQPSDELFWFHSPTLVLYLIHFILFQNSFETAFLFWIWCTYGFRSCIMERLAFIIPRIIVGVIVQVLCSYSTFPLYALVTQIGSRFKQGMFDAHIHEYLMEWVESGRRAGSSQISRAQSVKESFDSICIAEQPSVDDGVAVSVLELTHQNKPQTSIS